MMTRALLVLMLVLSALIAGCGGDDGGSATGSKDDPATAIPSDAPVAVRFATDLDGDAWSKNFAFADEVDPADRDLKQLLIQELDSDPEVKYTRDIKPWLGDEAMFFLTDYDAAAGEPDAGFVAQITDEDAAKKFIERERDGARSASYSGTEYFVDENEGAAGVVGGFFVFASGEDQIKAVVDAAGGASLAEEDRFRDAMDEAPDDAAATAYADVDRTLDVLSRTGTVPADTLDLIKSAPGFKAGQAATVSLVPDEETMTVEVSGPASGADPSEGPDVEDLPGDAWFAAAGPFMGEQFAAGFEQGLGTAGGAQATQLLDQLGVPEFLRQLNGFSARVGGTSVFALNGEITLEGDDAAAAKRLLDGAATQLESAGAPVTRSGDELRISVPPYSITAKTEGADVKLSVGDAPSSKVGDGDAYKRAKDELDMDRASGFVDFAGVEKLVRGIPNSDPDVQQVLQVLPKLGALIVGSEVDDGQAVSRLVLTLRD